MNPEEEYIQDVLRRLSRNFQGRLIFAGILDESAKLIHFQKGEVVFRLAFNRQAALDVQVSLAADLARQFEDFAGSLLHLVITYKDCEVIIMSILRNSTLYVICTRGASAGISDMLTKMAENSPEKRPGSISSHQQEFIEDEWSGQ